MTRDEWWHDIVGELFAEAVESAKDSHRRLLAMRTFPSKSAWESDEACQAWAMLLYASTQKDIWISLEDRGRVDAAVNRKLEQKARATGGVKWLVETECQRKK